MCIINAWEKKKNLILSKCYILQETLDAIDKNKDGFITLEEFLCKYTF